MHFYHRLTKKTISSKYVSNRSKSKCIGYYSFKLFSTYIKLNFKNCQNKRQGERETEHKRPLSFGILRIGHPKHIYSEVKYKDV